MADDTQKQTDLSDQSFEDCLYISQLISFNGNFNDKTLGLDDYLLKGKISKSLEASFAKNGVDRNSSFRFNNSVAFKLGENALSISLKDDRIDFYYQYIIGKKPMNFFLLQNVFNDFIVDFSRETNAIFYKLTLSKTLVVDKEFSLNKSFLEAIFSFFNSKTSVYASQTTIDKGSMLIPRTEDVNLIRTLSFGLIKNNNSPKLAIQVDCSTSQLNTQPRFLAPAAKKFIRLANSSINQKIQETIDLVDEYEKNK